MTRSWSFAFELTIISEQPDFYEGLLGRGNSGSEEILVYEASSSEPADPDESEDENEDNEDINNEACYVFLRVMDENDSPVRFSRAYFTAAVSEAAPIFSPVFQLTAHDADCLHCPETAPPFTFSIVGLVSVTTGHGIHVTIRSNQPTDGHLREAYKKTTDKRTVEVSGDESDQRRELQTNTENPFTLDPLTGVVRVIAPLDREKVNIPFLHIIERKSRIASYELRVSVTDGTAFHETGLRIDVLDENDNPPLFTPTTMDLLKDFKEGRKGPELRLATADGQLFESLLSESQLYLPNDTSQATIKHRTDGPVDESSRGITASALDMVSVRPGDSTNSSLRPLLSGQPDGPH
ncbi:unnamed protein product, partial [Protopolystoma xenopodis]